MKKFIFLIFALVCFSSLADTNDKFIKLTTQNKTLYTALNDGSLVNPTWVQETPSCVSTSCTISFTPLANSAVFLFIDGIARKQVTEYTVSGTTITLAVSLGGGQDIYAIYPK